MKIPGNEWRTVARIGETKLARAGEGVFDELVVDDWLHIERMDDETWWLRVGDARLEVQLDAEGRASVNVVRGFYAQVRGVTTEHDPRL